MKYMISVSLMVCIFNGKAMGSAESASIPAIVYEGDTIPNWFLPQVYVYPKLVFKDKKQEKFYWRTVRDVKKTLPYAKMIAKLLNETNAEMAKMATEKERKAFMKKREKELYDQYEGEFKKMTLSQGKLLIRLVDRECDRTSYSIIKDLRGGFRAFFWQGFACMLGANLKTEYDMDKEENQIVERVINLVEAGQL